MVAGPLLAPGKRDHERHALPEGQSRLAQMGTLAGLEEVSGKDRRKPLADIIDIAAHNNELQRVHRASSLWRLMRA